MSDDPTDDLTDEEYEEAWACEIERRAQAVDSGEINTSDWNVLRTRIEREIFKR